MADLLNHDGRAGRPGSGTLPLVSPVTGEVHGSAPRSSAADVDRACRAAARAFPSWSRTPPIRRQEALLALGCRDRPLRRGLHRRRGRRHRQAGRSVHRRRTAGRRRSAAVLRRGRPHPARRAGGGVHRRLHLDAAPRADRRLRPDRALELPADDGDLEDRSGAGGGQHRRAQARRDDAVLGGAAGPDRRGRPAARRAQRDLRGPGHRPGAGRASGAPPGRGHRQPTRRPGDRAGRRGRRQTAAPGARRQRPGDRARRRRPRSDGRRPGRGRLLQRGPGLHRAQPGPGPARRPRRLPGRRWSRPRRPSSSARSTTPASFPPYAACWIACPRTPGSPAAARRWTAPASSTRRPW